MKDILGRDVNDYDLVLGMTVGRHSDGMRHGVFLGKSVCWKRCSSIMKSTLSNMYLIENPTEKELKIKEDIMIEIKQEQEGIDKEKQRKREIKKLSKKEIEVNSVYKDLDGQEWLYLGSKKVTIMVDGESRFEVSGKYCYIYKNYIKRYLDFKDEENASNIISDWGKTQPYISLLKTPKQFVEKTEENVVISNEYKGYFSSYYGRNRKVKMTIEDVE